MCVDAQLIQHPFIKRIQRTPNERREWKVPHIAQRLLALVGSPIWVRNQYTAQIHLLNWLIMWSCESSPRVDCWMFSICSPWIFGVLFLCCFCAFSIYLLLGIHCFLCNRESIAFFQLMAHRQQWVSTKSRKINEKSIHFLQLMGNSEIRQIKQAIKTILIDFRSPLSLSFLLCSSW